MKFFLTAFGLLFFFTSQAQNLNLQLRSHITYPYTCANIWGYTDAQGHEYALVGTEKGLSIVDITDPDNATVLFDVPHNENFWREVKVFADRAYVVNEAGGGVLIVDLSQLPNSIDYHSFTGYNLKTAHTLWVDEQGKLYLFGYNTTTDIPESQRGMMILDLNPNPDSPTLLGTWNGAYIHDAFVRGDTVWAGLILDGQLAVLNASNPQNVQLMALQTTPSSFCHNAWPTSDNHYVFTTDEKPNSFLTCYDVSALSNIKETDRIQSNPGSNVVIHNVQLQNDDFAWVSYYRDGVVLFDISDKENLVQVGNYDTSPLAGPGFNGNWGVYNYFPSGTIVLSDIEGGLFVLTPTYVKAARIQGTVTNAVTAQPVYNASVNIIGTNINNNSNINGIYKTGIVNGGSYQLHFTRFGYEDLIVPVTLFNDSTIVLDVQMVPLPSFSQTFTVVDSATLQPLPHAQLFVTNYGLYNYVTEADANGIATIDTFYGGTYDIISGAWGNRTKGFSSINLTPQTGAYTVKLPTGYYDDFYFDFGWTNGTNPAVGLWLRDVPNGTSLQNTICNPNQDVVGDFGAKCYVTGNAISSSPGDDDVDDGCVILISPVFDLSGMTNPLIKYSRWFCNTGGATTPNDSMKIIIGNGITTAVLEHITPQNNASELSKWVDKSIAVKNKIALTNNMRLYIRVCDVPPGHLVEGGFDYFRIKDTLNFDFVETVMVSNTDMLLYPNPAVTALNLNIKNFNRPMNMQLTDITGRIVQTFTLTAPIHSFDLKDLEPGVYLIHTIDEERTMVHKFIKQ